MDPNETLKQLRGFFDRIETVTTQDEEMSIWLSIEALFRGLDIWLSGGGFLPTAWNR